MSGLRAKETNELKESLKEQGYFIDDLTALIVAAWLEDRSGPLILEGPPGSGKTILAKCLAAAKRAPLYRLECYRSVGRREALYYWDERLQEIELRRWAERNCELPEAVADIIYQPRMMIPGVLTRALRDPHADVFVLINELQDGERLRSAMKYLLQHVHNHRSNIHLEGESVS